MTSAGTVTVREAVLADAPHIARIHVECWQHAYRGIVPQDLLDSLSVERREAQWTRVLGDPAAAPERGATLVTVDGNERLTGFAQVGVPQDGSGDGVTGELYAIYLAPAVIGTGTGRALLAAAMRRMRDAGFTRARLDVLPGNERARRVYEAAGWRAEGEPWDVQHGEYVLPHQRYVCEL